MKCVVFGGFFLLVSLKSSVAEVIDYAKGVLPIMKEHCWDCHSNETEVKGNLALDPETLFDQIGKYNIIRPGDPVESGFVERLKLDETHNDFMPRKGSTLPKQQIEVIENWIAQGAIVDAAKMTAEEEKRVVELKGAGTMKADSGGDDYRQWTNLAGKVIEAKLISFERDSVKLLLKTGKSFDVPLESLSAESVALAKELGEK